MSTCSPSTIKAKTDLAYKALNNIASTGLHAWLHAFSINACQGTLRRPLIVHHALSLPMIFLVTDKAEGLRTKHTLKVPKFGWNYLVYSRTISCRAKEDVIGQDQRVDKASFII